VSAPRNRLEVKRTLARAWDVFSRQAGYAIAGVAILFVLSGVVAVGLSILLVFPAMAIFQHPLAMLPGQLVAEVGAVVTELLLGVGLVKLLLDLTREGRGRIGDVFKQRRYLVEALIGYVVTSFLVFLALIPGAAVGVALGFGVHPLAGLAVGWLLGVGGAIYVGLVLFPFTNWFVVDRDLDGIAAMRASLQCVRGNQLRMILYVICCFGIMLGGVLALGITVFLVSFPLILLATTRAYLDLSAFESEPAAPARAGAAPPPDAAVGTPVAEGGAAPPEGEDGAQAKREDGAPAKDEGGAPAKDEDGAPAVEGPTAGDEAARCARCRARAQGAGVLACEACPAVLHRRCWRKTGRCPRCRGAHAVLPGAPPDDGVLDLVPPAPPRWLGVFVLVLLLPLAGGTGPTLLAAVIGWATREAGLPLWAAGVMATGGAVVPVAIGLAALVYRTIRFRPIRLDDRGVVVNRTAKWRGDRLVWKDLAGFKSAGGGLALVVHRRPWTRWLGPRIPCDERLLHDITVRLERHGVPRLDG